LPAGGVAVPHHGFQGRQQRQHPLLLDGASVEGAVDLGP
jgi:hypothetical protein